MHQMKRYLLFVPLAILLFEQIKADPKCDQYYSCDECFSEFECAWCIKANTTHRCMTKSEASKRCNNDLFVVDEKFETKERNDDNTEGKMNPHKVKLTTSLNTSIISFTYKRPSKTYPLDLYYIMDLSNSMKAFKDELVTRTESMVDSLTNITYNLRIGFGSFIDKPVLPYVNTEPRKLETPCNGCSKPYAFKNHLSLINDIEAFKEKVRNAATSGNIDPSEGGLEALVQAIVCQEIGWREKSRRIIVLSTDDDFHVAGDGRLAGIVEPCDGKCHMEGNYYSEYNTYDYPSIGRVVDLVKEHHINLLFIINKNKADVYDKYEMLTEWIPHSNVVDVNGQIDELITNFYKNITEVITFSTDAKDVETDFAIDVCNGNSSCSYSGNSILNVNMTINVTNCLTAPINIHVTSGSTSLVSEVELHVVCNCSCGQRLVNSHECNNHGSLSTCLECKCEDTFFGEKCECNSSNSHVGKSECMENSIECSNHGHCSCGKCSCNDGYEGKFCHCDNNSCEKTDGKLCSGHGHCKCGKCECEPQYTGNKCDCLTSSSSCVNPETNKICSNNGKCACGNCQCYNGYHGDFCEKCLQCPETRCKELESCVYCEIDKLNDGSPRLIECCNETLEFNFVSEAQKSVNNCSLYTDDGCSNMYTYTNTIVEIERQCPMTMYALGGSIIGSLLLATVILLLVWRLLRTLKDKREYAQFEEDEQQKKWSEESNPLYKSAVTTFNNPMYENNK